MTQIRVAPQIVAPAVVAPEPVVEVVRARDELRSPRHDSWLKAFNQQHVPYFDGKVGLEVEHWIGHVESALEAIRCPEERQIEIFHTLFRGQAQYWWRTVRGGVTRMDQLLSLVRETFCPDSLRRDKVQDFLEAGFEDVPVIEAIRQFRTELALLGPAAPPADQHVYLFSRRLRESTRAYLAGFRCTSH